MINILVAIRTWGQAWTGKTLLVHCDNAAVVSVLATGATKDLTLAAMARNITMEVAKLDINLRSVHIAGKINVVADCLSRRSMGNQYRQKLHSILPFPQWVQPPENALTLNWLILILDVPPRVVNLASRAAARVSTGFRQSTIKAYDSMFRVFLSFCIFAGADVFSLSPNFFLTFLEFLTFNGLSPSAILNYVSAIKTKFTIFSLDTSPLSDPRIKYFHKSLLLNRPFKVAIKSIIDPPILISIVNQCDLMFMGTVFKAAYLLSFFSFLRISNLVPHTINSYDPLQQLSRADIIFALPGALVFIKWSKTLQYKNKVKILKIPYLGTSPLCPIRAIKNLLKFTPGSSNSPLFQVQYHGSWVPLTDTRLRKNLNLILKKLKLQN